MKSMIRTLAFGTVSAALLAACSTSPDTEESADWLNDARLGEKVDRICFTGSIDNFRAATRETVIVEKGVNDEYLLEMMGKCSDLDRAQSLSLDTFGGSSCLTKGDSIFAYDSVFGPDRTDMPAMRCPIRGIYKWNEDALEDDGDEAEDS